MQDKRDELYNNLIKSGKVSEGQIGTIDQFKSSVKDEATAKKFHENLMGAGFSADEIGDGDVFYGAISSDFQQSKVAPVQAGAIQQPSQTPQQSVQAPPPSKKDVEIFGGIPYSEYQKLPGKERLQVYSKWQGDKDREAQAKLRGSNNNQVESLYADVNKEMESLSASEKVEAPAGSGFIPASARGAAQRYGNAQNKEKQDRYTMLQSAKDLLENSQEMIAEAGKKGDTSFFGGAGRGFRDKAFDLDTWAMGVTDLYKNKFIQNAAEKADKGEALTQEEQKLLDAATVNMATQALFSSDLGRGYKAGGVTAESLPFMLEMIANPAATAGKGVGNAILRYGVKKFGAKAAEKATGVVAKKLLGSVAKASTRVAGDVLAAGAMTATSGIARTAADAVSRNTGQVTYGIDEEGNAEYAGVEGGVSGVEAAYKAFAGNTIENFSEMFGGYFGALGGVIGKTRPMQALKASKVGEAFSKINSSDWAKTVAEFEKKTNYNGTFGEYGEEVVGTILNSIFTGDQSLGELADVDQQIDTFLGVSLMGGFMSSVKALGYRTPKYEAEKNLRKAEKDVSSYFGEDWVGIRSTLEEADVEDRTAYLSSVLSSEMNAGEKKAMFEYVSKLTTRDAIKAGDEKLTEEGVDLNDGIAQNKASVYNGYNEAAKKALKSLPIEVIEEIDQQIEGGVGGDQLHQYIADKGLPENQSDDLLDYSVAKQDFNDYINGVQTRIDSEKANARQQMESVSNPDMGATVRVKSAASEAPIHVVGGKLAFDEQGFVDEKQSDEVVYYVDEDGERKMAAPSMFESLIDSTPTEELIAQAEADVENGIIAQEDLDLSPLEVGQGVYTPNGIPGEVIRFTAEGDPIVLSDTGEQVFKKEELISGIRVDEANIKKGSENKVLAEEITGAVKNDNEITSIPNEAAIVDPLIPVIEDNAQQVVPENASTETPSEIAPERTLESLLIELPKKKDGAIDYKGMTPRQVFEYTRFSEGDETAIGDLQADIKDVSEDLGKIKSKVAKAKGVDRIELREQSKEVKAKLNELQAIMSEAVPVQAEDTKAAPVMDADLLEWTADNSNDADELLSAYNQAKEMASHDSKLKPWEQSLLGRKVSTDSFMRFADRNLITGQLAKGWLSKDATSIDQISKEFEMEGLDVNDQDIVDFIIRNPSNYVRKTSDTQNKLGKRFSETASKVSGMPIGSPESVTGRLFIQNIQQGKTIEGMRQATVEQASQEDLGREEIFFNSIPDNDTWTDEQVMESVLDGVEYRDGEYITSNEMTSDEIDDIYSQLEFDNNERETEEAYSQEDEFENPFDEAREIEEPGTPEVIAAENREDKEGDIGIGGLENSEDHLAIDKNLVSLHRTNQLEYNEISESVSQGELGAVLEEDSRSEEPSYRLRRRIEEASRDAQKGEGSRGDQQEVNGIIEEQAKEDGLWTPIQNVSDFGIPFLSGSENDTYLDRENGIVYKVNNLMNSKELPSLFQRIDLHNEYFPQTRYEFVGVTGFGNNSAVYPIYKQEFVDNAEFTSTNEIGTYMQSLGFSQVGEATYSNEDVIISDLRPRNVLKDQDGDIYVIDADFKKEDKASPVVPIQKAGESLFDYTERIDESQRVVQEKSIEAPEPTNATPSFVDPEIKPDEDILRYAERVVKSEELHAEQSKVNTDPTDGQKDAGNYKMGHIKIGGHGVTIENPKGSVRRGVSDDGKAWETPMNNAYGYFRGTKGKDGDHIDTFLGDNLEPENVYVVDQMNEDGSFDEHKVMYGFESEADARAAYLSNYEEGWQGLGEITGVPRGVFDEWLGGKTKKQKPFVEYKVIRESVAPEYSADIRTEEIITEEVQGGEVSQIQEPLYGAENKAVSSERYEELKKKLRSKLGQMNVGFDPELFALGSEMAAFHIEAGARKITDFANRMIADVGDGVRPYLKSFYEAARNFPGMESVAKEMDSYKKVTSFDVNAFDKLVQNTSVQHSTFVGSLFDEVDATNNIIQENNESNSNTVGNHNTVELRGVSSSNAKGPIERESRGASEVNREQSGKGVSVETGSREERGERERSRRGVAEPVDAIVSAGESNRITDDRGRDGGDTVHSTEGGGDRSGVKNTRNHIIERGSEVAPKGDTAKIRANISAIKLAKKLHENGKVATSEQMHILQKYTGWGGLSSVFKEDNPHHQSLKDVLSDEEYDSARASTTTSFYTPASIVSSTWDMIERLGFKGGVVLEPSAGIGHFFGLMPQSISTSSSLRGIELDRVSGLILKALYPDAKVDIGGFEEQRIANNSVDLVVSNVPFGSFKLYDKSDKDISSKFDIHDFFIAKSIRKLKPGGIGVFITTSSSLDRSAGLRSWVINDGNADFIDAIRLNSDTFKNTAGTEATADVVIIRKRDESGRSAHSKNMQDAVVVRQETYQQEIKPKYSYMPSTFEDKKAIMRINKYFADNPTRVAGIMKFGFEGGNEIRPTEQRCSPENGLNQEKVIRDFVESLPADVYNTEAGAINKETLSSDGTKEGGLTIIEGSPCTIEFGEVKKLDWNSNKVSGRSKNEALSDYIDIRKAINELLSAENENTDNIEGLRDNLNKVYDRFVDRYGYLSNNKKILFLRDDVDFPSISAIENVKDVSKPMSRTKEYEITKSDIFSRRMISAQRELKADNVADAINLSLYKNGKVELPYIAKLIGKSEEEVRDELLSNKLGFVSPSSGLIEDRNEYLSGNVREKLAIAEQSNESGEYSINIEELSRIIPNDIPIHLIKISLGSTWVPTNVYDQFFKEEFDVVASIIKTSADKFSGNIEHVRTRKNEALGIGSDALGSELAFDAMNNTSTSIYRREYIDGKMVSIKDVVATAQAAAKQTELSELFESWCKKGGNPYSEKMESVYNNTFNAVVEKRIDVSSFESFPGAVTKKIPRDHQKEGVLRSLEQAVLLAHEVGTGKTITLISAAMEMRRLGLAKKPVIVVQRSTFDQFVREIKELYPSAKVLVPSAKDLTSAQRQQLFSKIAYNDWDIVVLYHSYLDAIPDSQERVNQYIDDQIQEKMDMLKEVSESNADNSKRMASQLKKDMERLEEKKVNVKQEEKTKANTKAHTERLMDRRTDNVMTFEQLGIDALLIDEAHAYKKLGFSTSLQNIKGIDTAASQRSQSLRLKSTYILENNQGRNVVFATGTPISNTMAEMWTFMRYLLSKSELRRLQMNNFDAFVNNFGSIEESSEFGTNGKFRVTNRFSSFSNTPELLSIWKQVSHTVLTEEVSSLKEGVGTPRLESGKPIDVMIKQTAALKAVMRSIKNKLEEFENMPGAQKKENSHIPLVMFGLAKRAAIDVRLVDPNLPDDPSSKLNETVKRIVDDLDETKEYNGTVAVFCDSYQSSDKRFNVFGNIKQKLIDKGVATERIAVINDYNTDDKRGKLFEQLNSGDVRVVMGTTEKLGVGVNMQERLHLLVHMDAPIRPSDYQQRNGRIARQGNKHLEMGKEIRILRIGVEQTLDVTGYQRLEIKKKFIDQIMKGDVSQRSIEESDMDGSDSNNFSQMMAQLSGSQSALAHSIEMNKLRKLKNAKTYHEQGQIHLSNEIKRNKSIISTTGQQIKKLEKDIEDIKSEFPSSEISTVKVGNKEVRVDEAPALLSKTLGKRIDAEVDALKKDFSREGSKISAFIHINGVKLAIEVDIERAYNVEKKSTKVKKRINISFDSISNSEMSVGAAIENVIPVAHQFISCKEIKDQIRKRKIGLEKAMRDNEAYEPKIGEVFPKQNELEKTGNRVSELEARMKEELAEIEAREAKEVIEEIDLSGSIESEELLYRGSGDVDNQGELTDIKKASIEFASNLGSRITFISRENLPKGHEKAKGYFDTKTGLIYVCAENHQSVEDVERTILHEAISHKGLRDMLGVGFGDFLDDVFKNASDDVRLKIMNMANGYDGNHRVATEEYLAELAESGFKDEQNRSIWNKIKDSFLAMLRKIGIRIELTDADLRSILKKSYDNLVKIGGIKGLDNAFEEDGTPSDEILFRDSEGESILRHVEEDQRSITQVIDAIRRINEIKKNELSERTWGTKAAEGLFDDAFKLKKLQDIVEAERGDALAGYMNPYQYITSIPKRNEYETERFNEQYMRPIYKEMRAMKDAGASEKGIYAYLYAKSGLERNEKMRTKAMMEYIDAIDDADIRSTLLSESSGLTIGEMYFSHENAEKKKMSLLARDYSGLTELREILFDEDSNKGEGRIQEWVDEFENKYEIGNLWASINLATKATLENEFRAGKIDKATKKKIEGMYDYYLPLRKWEGEQASDVWEYANGDQKEGIGSVIKKAFGRKSLAGNPIVNIGLMGQQSIHSGNRNELKQMFLSMARNNPNEAYAVSPLWIKNIGTEGSENWVETAPEWDDNPDVFAENVERFDEEMAALQKDGRAKQKYTRGSVGMPITKIEANEHQVVVSEAGKRYVVYVNSDPAIARAINGIGGKAYSVQDGKALSNDFVQKIIRGNGMIMRTMGQSFTTWNPMFVLANGQRDIMNALLVASVKEGKEYAGEMAKNMFSTSVHGTIMRAVLGKADMNNPIDKLFAEYESNGGETGFSELFKDSDFERQIKKELSKKKINPMDVIHLYLNNVEKLNRWAENISRFSTYKASRDSGRDVYSSVYDAKEITVNFNRKGTGACGGNFLRLVYIFSGAGLQAAYQIGRLSINRKTKKKAAVLMASVAIAGYLIPLMNNMLLGGDGDDIEDGYDFKPEYERKSNIMTRIGKGKFAKLSIPQELRPFWNIGETLYQLTRGNIDTWEASVGIMKGFAGVMPFDPFGSSGLVPTVLQPIDQVRNNENFFGGKIYKEETRYNKNLPQWRRSFRNTSPIAVGLSKWLNDATGGDEATQGWLDVSPGGMESLVEGYFGGAVKFVNNMAKTTKGVAKAIDGDSSFLETRNIPFVSSFYVDSSNPISKEVERLYWDGINLSEKLGTREREYRKLIEEHPEKILYFQDKLMELKESKDYERKKIIDGYSSEISNMNELINSGILDGKSKTVVLNQIKDLKKNMLNEINKIK